MAVDVVLPYKRLEALHGFMGFGLDCLLASVLESLRLLGLLGEGCLLVLQAADVPQGSQVGSAVEEVVVVVVCLSHLTFTLTFFLKSSVLFFFFRFVAFDCAAN